MSLVKENNSQAFEGLYDRYGGVAYSIALRITRRSDLAEDVIQQSFLELWRNRVRYEHGRGSVKSWLFSIVHNRAVDANRRSGVDQRTLEDSEQIELIEGAQGEQTEHKVLRQDTGAAVRKLLARLPEEQAIAIRLAYFEGQSQSEIAERLSLPIGTVKGRMRLALEKLHAALLAEGIQ